VYVKNNKQQGPKMSGETGRITDATHDVRLGHLEKRQDSQQATIDTLNHKITAILICVMVLAGRAAASLFGWTS